MPVEKSYNSGACTIGPNHESNVLQKDSETPSYYAPILLMAIVVAFVLLMATSLLDNFVPFGPVVECVLDVITAMALGIPTTYAVHRVVRRRLVTGAAACGAILLLTSTIGNLLQQFTLPWPLSAVPLFNDDHPVAFVLQDSLLLIGIVFFHLALALCVMAAERDRGELRAQRKQLNSALKEAGRQRRRAQGYLDVAGIVLIAVDADLHITMINPTGLDLLGYSESELLGAEAVETLIPKHLQAQVREQVRDLFEGRRDERENVVSKIVTKNGVKRTVNWSNRLLRDDAHNITGMLCSATDITERLILEQQMQQAQKLESLGVLAGGIAHDFNNLLVGILGNLELALTAEEDEPMDLYLEDAHRSGKRAVELTQQMLAYAGRASFRLRAVDLSALVRDTGALIQASLPKKVRVVYDLAEDLPQVFVDQAQIRQVAMNLITNAGEAVGDHDGEVRIKTWKTELKQGDVAPGVLGKSPSPGVYTVLEVSDTGSGMDADTQRRIFEPFFTTKFSGRGLGLAAVLGIVRAHGGGLEVQSILDWGTTFRIYLPQGEAAKMLAAETPPELRRASGDATILVIEDEALVRRTLYKLLRNDGYQVISAADGVEGLELYDENADDIDAVVLDLTMPRMDGRETFASLRERRPNLPVLVLSGYDTEETASGFESAPSLAFMQKPFDQAELLGTLAKLREDLPANAGRNQV
jgi:PAS domain S-box-containing protein